MKKYRINRMLTLPFFIGDGFAQANYKPNEGFYLILDDKNLIWAKHETDSKQDMLTALPKPTLDIWVQSGIISPL